jgi:hypothetical protein
MKFSVVINSYIIELKKYTLMLYEVMNLYISLTNCNIEEDNHKLKLFVKLRLFI